MATIHTPGVTYPPGGTPRPRPHRLPPTPGPAHRLAAGLCALGRILKPGGISGNTNADRRTEVPSAPPAPLPPEWQWQYSIVFAIMAGIPLPGTPAERAAVRFGQQAAKRAGVDLADPQPERAEITFTRTEWGNALGDEPCIETVRATGRDATEVHLRLTWRRAEPVEAVTSADVAADAAPTGEGASGS